MRIGFIGLGVMGGPMAGHILDAGHELTVYGRRPETTAPYAAKGARVVGSPLEVAQASEIVHLCVWASADSREVVLGENGVAGGLEPGDILIDHGTVDVQTNQALADAAAARGAGFLDAPISGAGQKAIEADLTVMVGGDADTVKKALPILELFGRVVHAGPLGAGTTCKLANQMLSAIHIAAAAEAYRLINSRGVDAEKFFDIMRTASGNSSRLQRVKGLLMAGNPIGRNNLDILIKDVSIADELAGAGGVELPVTEQVLGIFKHYQPMLRGVNDGR